MTTKIKIDIPNAEEVVDKYGLGVGGDTQHYFSNTLHTLSAPYVPFGAGSLFLSGRVNQDGTQIDYYSPYARIHWYGEIMVDPITGLGGYFLGDEDGWVSRRGVKKIKASEAKAAGIRPAHLPDEFNYKGSPMRGSEWVKRAYIDNQEAIVKSLELYIVRRG